MAPAEVRVGGFRTRGPTSRAKSAMKPLTFDEVRQILPDLSELAPVLELLLASSDPDPAHLWSGSGELETEGARHVDSAALSREAGRLADRTREHLTALYTCLGEALQQLSRGDRDGAAEALLEAAALEEGNARADRARAYARSAYRLARDAGGQAVASRALRRWARAAKDLGDLNEAGTRYDEGFEVAVATGDGAGAAEAAIGIGNVLEQQGRWSEARGWYERALDVLQDEPDDRPERWQAMVNIHIVLRSAGALGESLDWLRRAEAEASRQGATDAEPFLRNARGQLHAWEGAFAEAEQCFRQALDATGHPGARVTIRLNLAESLLAQERLLDATEEAREAEREALRGAVLPKLPEIYRFLGRTAVAKGNPDAFVLFERALEIQRERGLPLLEQALTLQAYAQGERARGEQETADALLDRARELYSTLGISDLRHPWSDVYAKTPDSPIQSD